MTFITILVLIALAISIILYYLKLRRLLHSEFKIFKEVENEYLIEKVNENQWRENEAKSWM